ncbi:MAG TPA: putative metal-dependent hydrolase [Terriglobia bacterium]|nr:putative metal-dependent hydrolase [Terriglobia bacterium]
MSNAQYPIGKFQPPAKLSNHDRQTLIKQIEEAPAALWSAVTGLSEEQIDTPYREGGWTVRQVVHHLADSHMNAFVRFKLAMTEDQPAVKTYEQQLWAELPDAKTVPVVVSLNLVDSLHKRFAVLLQGMAASDFARTLNHPEMGIVPLDQYLALYAWHGRHHVAHITSLRERMGWK